MALTAKVKDELARVSVSQESAQAAEISTLFRFAGGLHLVAGSIVLEAELDSGAVARRLRSMLAELYDVKASLNVLSPGGLRKTSKYIVRVTDGAELVVRQTGLIDSAGRPVRGLPRKLIMGQKIDQEAAWRGAFS